MPVWAHDELKARKTGPKELPFIESKTKLQNPKTLVQIASWGDLVVVPPRRELWYTLVMKGCMRKNAGTPYIYWVENPLYF